MQTNESNNEQTMKHRFEKNMKTQWTIMKTHDKTMKKVKNRETTITKAMEHDEQQWKNNEKQWKTMKYNEQQWNKQWKNNAK
jgi:hypothetical protein